MSGATARIAVLLVATLAAGCLSRSPKPELYRLNASAVGAAPVASLPGLGLAIGPVDFPRYLDRSEFVTREGAHGIQLETARRWAGSLRSQVQRVVADDLGALLGTARVARHPAPPRFPVDWRVVLDVRAFEGVPGERVVLRARWMVARGDDGQAAAVEESVVEQPVASAAWDDYVAAHDAALAAVTREIAERIAALEAR